MANKNVIVLLNYLNVCKRAAQDDSMFKSFKKHIHYSLILEHCTYQMGADYITEIKKNSPDLMNHVSKFITNDLIGRPNMFWYEELNENVSPTTLRYIKVLGDLINLFGSLDGIDIVEIGGGYGGQCKMIHDIAKPHSYTIIDLPEVLLLAEKYLTKFNVQDVKYVSPIKLRKGKYDLCISNYAFTEIERKYQDIYVKDVIDGSARGYITCNFLEQRRVGYANRFNKKEIFDLKPNGKFLSEIPLTGLNNIIYTWNLPVK